MRSDLVFGALAHISNRYHLCRLISKGTRKLHVPKARLQETTNDVLVRLRQSRPIQLITPQSVHLFIFYRMTHKEPRTIFLCMLISSSV